MAAKLSPSLHPLGKVHPGFPRLSSFRLLASAHEGGFGIASITEVISDQLADNEANKLPTPFYGGHPNNPMLMATRFSDKARLAFRVSIPAVSASSAFVGVRVSGQSAIIKSVSCVAAPAKTYLTFDAVDGVVLYEVVAGRDKNGNNALDPNEAILFQGTPKTNVDGTTYSGSDTTYAFLDRIFIVTQTDFDNARNTTNNYAIAAAISPFHQTAAALLSAFANGVAIEPRQDDIPISAQIPSAYGLSHPVGARWSSTNTSTTHRVAFSKDGDLANSVTASRTFSKLIEDTLEKQKDALFSKATDVWSNQSVEIEEQSISFKELDNAKQVHVALGKCQITGTLLVSCIRSEPGVVLVRSINCSGTIKDLYDFSINAPLVIGFFDPKEAARTQAGYATLTGSGPANAGKMFFTKVEFETGWRTWTNPNP